jgi:anti-sigma factor RsiW
MGFDREKFDCPVQEISAYIDGELDEVRERELEAHLESCPECQADLNAQKQFLCELDMRLREGDEVELPANFAKQIVVNAESSVAGLRPSRERYNALFICAGLLLFALFAMGAEAGRFINSGLESMERTAVVGGFVGHVVYSIVLGFVVVLRSFASQVHLGDLGGVGLAVFLCVSIAVVSRKFLRAARV